MPRSDCIYCGRATGSREHTFPAALGGRRFNKGIICGRCNSSFSVLDAALSSQLDSIAGLLGVRPDHSDAPRKAQGVDVATGRPIVMKVDGRPEAVTQVLREWTQDGEHRVLMEFPTLEESHRWLREQRSRGNNYVEYSQEKVEQFRMSGIILPLMSGGSDAMREIGRVGLNFLAHDFPEIARQSTLVPFKNWVLNAVGPPLVGFDFSGDLELLAAPSSPFVHRVLVSLDADRSVAYARVSLFSLYEFSVALGGVHVRDSASVLTEIDPLKELPTDVRRTDFTACVARPTGHVTVTEQSRAFKVRLDRFLAALKARQWDLGSPALLEGLNKARAAPESERARIVSELLQSESHRLLVLGQNATEPFRQGSCIPNAQALASIARMLVQEAPGTPSGITEATRGFIDEIRVGMSAAICDALNRGPISSGQLRDLLEGASGHRVASAVFRRIVESAS